MGRSTPHVYHQSHGYSSLSSPNSCLFHLFNHSLSPVLDNMPRCRSTSCTSSGSQQPRHAFGTTRSGDVPRRCRACNNRSSRASRLRRRLRIQQFQASLMRAHFYRAALMQTPALTPRASFDFSQFLAAESHFSLRRADAALCGGGIM